MASEPIFARTAWTKGGTTYVTFRWGGAVRTRVARPDGAGGWTITLPGRGDTTVVLPASIGTEPTEGRLAQGATLATRVTANESGARPARRSSTWQDLPPSSATPQAPRDRTVFSQALKTIRARADGATLGEIKESFREIDLYHHDPLTLLRWQHDNRGWGFKMNPGTGRITLWSLDSVPHPQHTFDERHMVNFSPPASAPSAPRNETHAHLAAEIERRRSEAQAESLRIDEERRRWERERQVFEEQRRTPTPARDAAPEPNAHAIDLERQRRDLAEQYRQLEQERQRVREIERRNVDAQAEWQRIQAEREHLEHARRQLEAERAALLSPADTELSIPVAVELDAPDWLLEIPDPDRNVFRHLADHGSINESEATRMLGGARQFRRFSVQFEQYLGRVPFKVRIEMSGAIKC